MIKHIVLFRFKTDVTDVDRRAFLEMLRTLPSKISGIVDFEAEFDVLRSQRSFDLALVASYADLESLDRYNKNENHLPVVERAKHLCEQVVSADYEY